MELVYATDVEISWIVNELELSKKRPKSGDFLEGFPWESIRWWKATLEDEEFENLFFFWDGIAWGKSSHLSYTLKDGVLVFSQISNTPAGLRNVHLDQINGWLEKYRNKTFQNNDTFLILGGLDQNSSLMILDGNHRAAAALWWAMECDDRNHIPSNAWVGLSPEMINYFAYRRKMQS